MTTTNEPMTDAEMRRAFAEQLERQEAAIARLTRRLDRMATAMRSSGAVLAEVAGK